MANKIYSRIQHKIGSEAEWNKAVNFIPLKGEMIIYTDVSGVKGPMIKIGDGETKVTELEFFWDEELTEILDAIVSDYKAYTDNETEARKSAFSSLSEAISDISYVDIDLEGSSSSEANPINADTLGGYSVDEIIELVTPTYELTDADKAEIAEQVENATIIQAPQYVNSVDEMTDTDRPYVLIETGHIWVNAETTIETEGAVTDTITATDDNPYVDGSRLSSSGDEFTNDAAGYHITPLIDLTKAEYQGKTIQIHLEGAQYASTGAYATYIQCRTYGLDKAVLTQRSYTVDVSIGGSGLIESTNGITVTYNSETSTIITMDVPPTYGSANIPIGYIRFCGKGAITDSKISITYTDTVTTTGVQWFDTGTSYAPALTDEEKVEIAEDVASMIDTQLLTVVGDGVVTV